MSNPVFPLEIRARIYTFLDDPQLSLHISEVFWAIAPTYFRNLTVGRMIGFVNPTPQTQLVERYPDSGCFVERLVIAPDFNSVKILSEFLKRFPTRRKLKHVTLVYFNDFGYFFTLRRLKYANDLEKVLQTSPGLTRLSFHHFQPSPVLISACADRLTRLDIGHIHTNSGGLSIPLTPRLQILSFTCRAVPFFTGTPPNTLKVLILKDDELRGSGLTDECEMFIARCSSVRRIGVVDDCKFLLFISSKLLNVL